MSRLHYLYEQAGGGKEHFVYYCSTCTCVISARRDLGPTSQTVNSIDALCKGCGRPLMGSVECRLAPIPEDWSDILVTATQTVQRPLVLFQPASSIPHFCLGFPRLDSLLRPLSEGHLVMFSGEPSSVVAELAAFRAQLPVESGGLDSGVLFIDGGNRSDPYVFSSFAKQRGLKPSVAMRRVTSCRVFTFYQLAALVSEHLACAAADYGTRLVVISDVLGTFNEPELDEREARRVLSAVEEGIEKTKKHTLVVATLPSANKYDDLYDVDGVPGNFYSGGVISPQIVAQAQNSTVLRESYSGGVVTVAKAAIVPGTVMNQFSMDEYNGNFRIATSHFAMIDGAATTSDDVYVLDANMNQVSALRNIAPGENIYAVRFVGQMGYVVTFQQVDPLFVISFKDVTNPVILSALKVSGYSDYLHPLPGGYLIGVGKDVVHVVEVEVVGVDDIDVGSRDIHVGRGSCQS